MTTVGAWKMICGDTVLYALDVHGFIWKYIPGKENKSGKAFWSVLTNHQSAQDRVQVGPKCGRTVMDASHRYVCVLPQGHKDRGQKHQYEQFELPMERKT